MYVFFIFKKHYKQIFSNYENDFFRFGESAYYWYDRIYLLKSLRDNETEKISCY